MRGGESGGYEERGLEGVEVGGGESGGREERFRGCTV